MSKRNKLMIIWVAVLSILVIGATFASWLITNKQTNFNTINSSCINVSFGSGNGSISLQNTAPMTDAQGLATTGYTFTLRNNCNTEVAYQLNLDIFNVANQTNLSSSELKLAIDNYVPRKVVYFDDTAKGDSSASSAKNLISGTIPAKTSETHTVKRWVDENTTTQNAVFSNRLFVMASPNLTVPEVASDDCFIMDQSDPGRILFYLSGYCPNNVIIPNEINGEPVTSVARSAFWDTNVITWYDQDNLTVDLIVLDEANYNDISNTLSHWLDDSLERNGGIIMNAEATAYNIYKRSEYTNWDTLVENYDWQDYILNDSLDSLFTGMYVKRLNIPLNPDFEELFDSSIRDIDVVDFLSADARNVNSIWHEDLNNQGSFAVSYYLESIDFSRCLSLETMEALVAYGNDNLTKVEFPNNSTFSFDNMSFASNSLTQAFIPTNTTNLKNAFYDNDITHVELYSTNTLVLNGPNAYYNNPVTSLTVNSTVTFSPNITSTRKPFINTPLTAAGITIGHNSTNTVSDFINVE